MTAALCTICSFTHIEWHQLSCSSGSSREAENDDEPMGCEELREGEELDCRLD